MNFFYTIHKKRKSTREFPKGTFVTKAVLNIIFYRKKVCHVHWRSKRLTYRKEKWDQKTSCWIKLKVTFTINVCKKNLDPIFHFKTISTDIRVSIDKEILLPFNHNIRLLKILNKMMKIECWMSDVPFYLKFNPI